MQTVYYIPNGPKNLQQLVDVSFIDIEEYFVEVKDTNGNVIATTTNSQTALDNDNFVHIHFLNSLGAIDSIVFQITNIEHDPKSGSYTSAVTSPLVKSVHAINRFNVRANDTYQACNVDYNEDDMTWIDELFDSPLVWMEMASSQGQPDDYIPIVLNDAKNQKRKLQDRYSYEVNIEFKLSHEKFILRN